MCERGGRGAAQLSLPPLLAASLSSASPCPRARCDFPPKDTRRARTGDLAASRAVPESSHSQQDAPVCRAQHMCAAGWEQQCASNSKSARSPSLGCAPTRATSAAIEPLRRPT